MGSRRLFCGPYGVINRYISLNRRASTLVHNKKVTQTQQPQETEEKQRRPSKHSQAGITEYIGCKPRIAANFKENYADFHVHEIDTEGNSVALTDLQIPKESPSGTFHTHCVLFKQGASAMDVVQEMGRLLKIPQRSINWAGIKDKDATTSQWISVANIDAPTLRKLSSCEDKRCNFRLGNFRYSPEHMKIGNLQGNKFKLLLRDIHVHESGHSSVPDFEKSVQNLRDFGFINYYGLQRFGTYVIPNFAVGRAIIQMNWEKVIDLIMGPPTKRDVEYMARAKGIWLTTRDPIRVVKSIPELKRNHTIQSTLFSALAHCSEDGKCNMMRVFKSLPRQLRKLHFTSFQSVLWNQMASFRIQNFGPEPIPGDMIYQNPDNKQIFQYLDDDNDLIAEKSLRMLTEEDLKESRRGGRKYTIHDVLLLGPGTIRSHYHHPEMQTYFEQLMKSHGLDPDGFQKFTPQNEGPIPCYRPLVMKPTSMTYSMSTYAEDVDLDCIIPSDYDKLLRIGNKANLPSRESRGYCNRADDKVCSIVEFQLPKSCYATMALREIVNLPQGAQWMDDVAWTAARGGRSAHTRCKKLNNTN